jgi:ornithine cyclodeaminase/alanine dehydrogenase-like protein (mu-crystallin family)
MKKKDGLLILNEATVKALLNPSDLLDELSQGFMALSRGEVSVPGRTELRASHKGSLLCMPAYQKDAHLTVKMVSIFPENQNLFLPTHLALICLFDPSTGEPVCVLDGTYITALRTALAAVLSVRLLSLQSSRVAIVVGSGVQAREHLRLLSLARHFDQLLVWGRSYEDACLLAEAVPSALAVANLEPNIYVADVVCLCTSSQTPVIRSEWVRQGTHVTSVGHASQAGELPPDLAQQRLFVETRQAFNSPPVGCSELTGIDPDRAAELGEVLLGSRPGRRSDLEITVYKAMGVAMEDLVAAKLAYRCARAADSGEYVRW